MSSDRIERKRRSEFDTSDNCAEEYPAVKIRRLDSAINIGKKVSEACVNLLNWITPEFIRNMAVRVTRSSNPLRREENNYRNQQIIDVEDNDDEECAIVGMQNGTDARSRSSSTSRINSNSRSSMSSTSSICPLAYAPCKFPLSADNRYYIKATQTMERRKVNGFSVGTETDREEVRRSRRNEKCVAPVTNPRSEIDIILEKDKDVEIIDEVYPAKFPSGAARRMKLLGDAGSDRCDLTSGFKNSAQSSYFTRSYTANEVVRLQEKAHYSLLLEKIVKRKPLYQPAFPQDDLVSTVQYDLTESDPFCYFKKEKVAANVSDFLSKYYKPVKIPVTPGAKNLTRSMPENETSKEDDDDDDIQIIEYPELPKLKPRKSSIAAKGSFFSDDWIADMKQSMISETEKILQRICEKEEKVLRYKKRREARLAEEMRKREEQRQAGFIFPEDVEMEEEPLPEITSEMNNVIQMTLALPNSELPICTYPTKRDTFEVRIRDIATLTNLNWLNDEVINFYLALLEERSKLDGYPKIFCFNSFFYPKLKRDGPSRMLLRWTRKFDIFAMDLIVVPLHLDFHWALLIVDNRKKEISYLDSMGGAEIISLDIVDNYLRVEMMDKKKVVLEKGTYQHKVAEDIPKQMNGSDCGMFALKYAEYITRDAPLTFTQENMPYFRRRMIYEIMTKQIL